MIEFRIDVRTTTKGNAKGHWRPKHADSKREREATRLALVVHRVASRPPALPVTVELSRLAPSQLDDDNVRGALKAIRDELADWLGLPTDRDPRCRWLYGQQKGGVREYAVLLRVWEGQRDCSECGSAVTPGESG